MIRSQGRYFSEGELKRIVMLLRESDMSLPEIADRMRCSRSAVASINRKFQVRLYEGRRSQWSINCTSAPVQKQIAAAPDILQEDARDVVQSGS